MKSAVTPESIGESRLNAQAEWRLSVTQRWMLLRTMLAAILTWAAVPTLKASPGNFDYLIRTWEIEDGLPQNSVISITQTRDGYLWLGTFNGLARFDGVRLRTLDPSNSKLGSGAIQALHGDAQGRLWILTVEQELFLWQGGELAPVTFDPPAQPTVFGLAPVVETPSGELLTATSLGIARWDGKKFADATESLGIPMAGPGNVMAASGGRVWVASGSKLGFLVEGRFEARHDLNGKGIRRMTAAANDGLWAYYAEGGFAYVDRFDFDGDTGLGGFKGEPMEGEIWCFGEDRDRTLWMGAVGYGLTTRGQEGMVRRMGTDDGMSHEQVRAVFEDREGNLWLGTDGGGVMRIKRPVFRVFGKASGLADEVYSVTPSPGGLDVGTLSKGVFHLPWSGHPVTRLGLREATRPIWRDREGALWAGTHDRGLFRQRKEEDSWDRIAIPGEREGTICLLEDRSGVIWAGGGFGLMRWNDGMMQAQSLREEPSAPSPAVCALAEDREGTIWAATRGDGLFSIRDRVVRRYTARDGLPSEKLLVVLAGPDGTVWIGTQDRGLGRYSAGRFFAYGLRKGLPRTVCQLVDDQKDSLWMGSFSGIHRVSWEELNAFAEGRTSFVRANSFGLDEGLKSLECSSGANPGACRTEDGRLWFGTIKGLAVVDPALARTEPVPPPVHVEEVRIDRELVYSNQSWIQSSAGGNAIEITVPAEHRVLNIRYTGVALKAPEQVRFKYRLQGFDANWIGASGERTAIYPRIPPGQYSFAVSAALGDGAWNETAGTIRLRVLPFWWETAWFRGFAGLSGMGLAWGAVRWHTRRKVRQAVEQAARQEAISEERTRISRDMHDGLGAKLTRVSLLARTLERPAVQEEARAAASQISSLTQGILRSMAEVVWAVDPKHDNLESLADYLAGFAQEHLALAGIKCRIDIPVRLPTVAISPATRHQLSMVFQEAIENVVRHSSASVVKVQMSFDNSILRLEVSDDGNGFAPGARPKLGSGGRGLENMRSRVKSLGGTIEIRSAPQRGTTISLSVPVAAAAAPV